MSTQPRCAGQKCVRRLQCAHYYNRKSGFVDQWNPKGCKKFVKIERTHKPMEPTR